MTAKQVRLGQALPPRDPASQVQGAPSPTGLLTTWLGAGNPVWSVPLAALLGVPVYLNTDASLPLVATLLDGGMAPGAGIAFLITGAGTSVGAISGMLVIARWRIVALVIGTLLVTATAAGWLAGLWL